MSALAKGKVGRRQQFYTLLANVSHHVCGSALSRADAAPSSVRSRAQGCCGESCRPGEGSKRQQDTLHKGRSH